MFGNNINGPYISPTMYYGPITNSPLMNTTNIGMRSAPMIGMNNSSMISNTPRSGGFLSSLLGLGGRNVNTGTLLSRTQNTQV